MRNEIRLLVLSIAAGFAQLSGSLAVSQDALQNLTVIGFYDLYNAARNLPAWEQMAG